MTVRVWGVNRGVGDEVDRGIGGEVYISKVDSIWIFVTVYI